MVAAAGTLLNVSKRAQNQGKVGIHYIMCVHCDDHVRKACTLQPRRVGRYDDGAGQAIDWTC